MRLGSLCFTFDDRPGIVVDYGATHSCLHKHAQFGRVHGEGLYPKWSAQHPLHFLGHSIVSRPFRHRTVRVTQYFRVSGWPDHRQATTTLERRVLRTTIRTRHALISYIHLFSFPRHPSRLHPWRTRGRRSLRQAHIRRLRTRQRRPPRLLPLASDILLCRLASRVESAVVARDIPEGVDETVVEE